MASGPDAGAPAAGPPVVHVDVEAIYLGAGFITLTLENRSAVEVKIPYWMLESRIADTVRFQSEGGLYRFARVERPDVIGPCPIAGAPPFVLGPGARQHMRVDVREYALERWSGGTRWERWERAVPSRAVALGRSETPEVMAMLLKRREGTIFTMEVDSGPCLVGGARLPCAE